MLRVQVKSALSNLVMVSVDDPTNELVVRLLGFCHAANPEIEGCVENDTLKIKKNSAIPITMFPCAIDGVWVQQVNDFGCYEGIAQRRLQIALTDTPFKGLHVLS